MGSVGVQEMIVIFVVALVLFGPKKLPELGRTLGRAISEFRRASNELKTTFEQQMHSLERENESIKEITQSYTNEVYSHYDSPYYDSGGYRSEPYDSTASDPYTVDASATQGVESSESVPVAEATPAIEGTVPRTPGTELAATSEPVSETEAPVSGSEPADTQKS